METTMTERTLGRKPKDIPTIGDFKDKNDENSFKWLQEEYANNDYNDDLTDALNCLQDDERNLMILYIVHKRKLAPLARYFHVSTPFLRKKLNEVREKIMQNYTDILNAKETTSYWVEKTKRDREKSKRPVVQAELYEKKQIAQYESVEDAATAINGNIDRIVNVCNGHSFKYMESRWYWLQDWNNFINPPKKVHWTKRQQQ